MDKNFAFWEGISTAAIGVMKIKCDHKKIYDTYEWLDELDFFIKETYEVHRNDEQ